MFVGVSARGAVKRAKYQELSTNVSIVSVSRRAGSVFGLLLNVRSDVPAMYEASYDIAAEEFRGVLDDLKAIEAELRSLESELEDLGAPYTPGRVPEWNG